MNENDFLNAMSMNIFYFEVLIEGHNQVRQQNYINNENKWKTILKLINAK